MIIVVPALSAGLGGVERSEAECIVCLCLRMSMCVYVCVCVCFCVYGWYVCLLSLQVWVECG